MRWRVAVFAALASACASTPAEAAISIVVTASRTSCVAPCAVWFDYTATTGLSGSTSTYNGSSSVTPTGDFVLANWTTTFNDPTSPIPTEIGFEALHVFETAGTYNVTTSVIDGSGATAGPTTTTITVSTISGTTFYASSSGSGTTCSIGSPCSAATALTHVATNNVIAFRNGDTWSGLSAIGVSSKTGPINFVGYSDPGSPSAVRPVLGFAAGADSITAVQLTSSSDIRFEHLHILPDQATDSSGQGHVAVDTASSKVLFDDMDIEGNPNQSFTGSQCFQDGVFSAWADGVYVVNSHLHNIVGYGWYADSPVHSALINSTVDNILAQCHGLRWQACNESSPGVCGGGQQKSHDEIVSHNTFDTPNSFTSFEFHGDSQSIVAAGNQVNNNLASGPQNTSAHEYLANVLWDSNLMNGAGAGALSFGGRHMIARNNILITSFPSFGASDAGQLVSGWVNEISLLNNTASHSGDFFSWSTLGAGTVLLRNNIAYNRSSSSGQFANNSSGNATITEDHNVTYSPSFASWTHPSGTGDVYGNPLFTTTPPVVAVDVKLQSGSPAKDAGTTTAAYYDYAGTTRPQNGTFDMGAYELVAPSAAIGRAYLFFCGGGF